MLEGDTQNQLIYWGRVAWTQSTLVKQRDTVPCSKDAMSLTSGCWGSVWAAMPTCHLGEWWETKLQSSLALLVGPLLHACHLDFLCKESPASGFAHKITVCCRTICIQYWVQKLSWKEEDSKQHHSLTLAEITATTTAMPHIRRIATESSASVIFHQASSKPITSHIIGVFSEVHFSCQFLAIGDGPVNCRKDLRISPTETDQEIPRTLNYLGQGVNHEMPRNNKE